MCRVKENCWIIHFGRYKIQYHMPMHHFYVFSVVSQGCVSDFKIIAFLRFLRVPRRPRFLDQFVLRSYDIWLGNRDSTNTGEY